MAEKTVKVLRFPYTEEVERRGQTVLVARTATRNDVIDTSKLHEYDLERAERLGAFYSDAEQAQIDEFGSTFGTPVPVTQMDDEQLVAWIKGELEDQQKKPTVQDVIDASEGSGQLAERLLTAEQAANDGEPRAGVEKGLEAVIARDNG